MESGTVGDSGDDLNRRRSRRWIGNCIVYTRRIHKKTHKTKNDTATTTASTAAAAAPENPTTTATPTPTKVSSATVASASTAEVSTASTSTSKDHNDSAVVSTTSTAPCRKSAGDGFVEALVSRKADSCQPRIWDESLHQEGSCNRSAELQNPEDSALANSDKAENLEKSSALHGQNDKMLQNLSESCPLSSGNCLSNGREVSSLRDDGELIAAPPQVPSDDGLANVNGFCKPLAISTFEGRVRFKLAKATSKDEIKKVQEKLECELDQVRRLVKQLEAKELQLASYNRRIRDSNLIYSSNYVGNEGGDIVGYSYPQPQDAQDDLVDRRMLVRATTEMGVMGQQEIRPTGLARANSDLGVARNLEMRPYSRQLSVAVAENNYVADLFVEKEKRIPKANRYYRNSEFLLGKDRLPPESNKRLKTNNGRKHGGEIEHAFRFANGFDKSWNQVFKSCSNLLQRLMKHNHGWVFNEPVNARALCLVDYHDIIKHPMDFGTIKTRLSQNWYKCPREFAEDVRLVFRNAMTYNPKGQDVHVMAEHLSQIFEEGWACIGTEYSHLWKYRMYQDAGLPTPNSRKALPLSHFTLASSAISGPSPIPGLVSDPVQVPACIPSSAPISCYAPAASQMMRTSDRPETMTTAVAADPRVQWPHSGRPPVLRKPKAKDPNKRDMTYDEKQRLSTNLQSMSAEKLDAIIQIIKKRSTALSQNDDEIEVDIDNVDAETLWELDRFVANYKKGLSKNKRKAEIALRTRSIAYQTVVPTVLLYAHFDSGVLHSAITQSGLYLVKSDLTFSFFYMKFWRRVLHLLWLKVKSRVILVDPAVPAVPAVILHLQVILIATVPQRMDQMQGIHLEHRIGRR